MAAKPSRAQLHELLQIISNDHNITPAIAPTVEYTTEVDNASQSSQQHVCHLTLQLPTDPAPQVFEGRAGKRKLAYEEAAALALAKLQRDAPQRDKVVLTDALTNLLMPPKGPRRNMELTNHLLTNVAAGHGPLVCLAAVARCKSVKQWLTEEGMLEEHIEAGAAYLRSTVLREREHIAAHSKMNVVHDGWAFQLQHDHPFMDKLFERNTIPPFTTTAVLLPADPLQPMQEVALHVQPPHTSLMDTIASVLSASQNTAHKGGAAHEGTAHKSASHKSATQQGVAHEGTYTSPEKDSTAAWRVLLHGKVGRRAMRGGPHMQGSVTGHKEEEDGGGDTKDEDEEEHGCHDEQQRHHDGGQQTGGEPSIKANQEALTMQHANGGQSNGAAAAFIPTAQAQHSSTSPPNMPTTCADTIMHDAVDLSDNSTAQAAAVTGTAAGTPPTTGASITLPVLTRPFLYSLAPRDSKALHGTEGLNARASWLAGYRIHGPALLALTWIPDHYSILLDHKGAYTLDHAHRHVGTMLPSAELASAQRSWVQRVVAGLPSVYRSSRVWQGPTPLQLLSTYATNHGERLPTTQGDPVSSVQVTAFPGGPAMTVAESDVEYAPEDSPEDGTTVDDDGSAADAQRRLQQAALMLLQQVEGAIVSLFGGGKTFEGGWGGTFGGGQLSVGDGDAGGGGNGGNGGVRDVGKQRRNLKQRVHVGDAVVLELDIASAAALGVSDLPLGHLYMDPAWMPPLLYTALLASRVGDALTVALDMPMVGPWDPLTAPFHIIPHATHLLTMRIHKISTARGGPHNAALFDPPLSLQRHGLMAAIAATLDRTHVVDIGCGAGRLLTHCATAYAAGAMSCLTTLTGCDVFEPAVKAADRAIQKLHTTLPGTQQLAMHVLHDDPLRPDTPCPAWAHNADILTMVEVIEHLDPGPLKQVPPLLFKTIRAPVVVVTTPNSEYNPIIAAKGGGLLANNMRNSDHRFEWTRAEFESWSKKQASLYGYAVRFLGVGHVADEVEVLERLGIQGNVGAASQVAVFTLEG